MQACLQYRSGDVLSSASMPFVSAAITQWHHSDVSALYVCHISSTPCLKKNDNDVAHYNFNAHAPGTLSSFQEPGHALRQTPNWLRWQACTVMQRIVQFGNYTDMDTKWYDTNITIFNMMQYIVPTLILSISGSTIEAGETLSPTLQRWMDRWV